MSKKCRKEMTRKRLWNEHRPAYEMPVTGKPIVPDMGPKLCNSSKNRTNTSNIC